MQYLGMSNDPYGVKKPIIGSTSIGIHNNEEVMHHILVVDMKAHVLYKFGHFFCEHPTCS